MHAEYARSIERSKASATLAKEVARLLAGYDTASARDALRFAEVADAELSEALEAIVENLEAYRPHLPNWLVNAAACASSSGKASENDTDTADEPSTNFDSRSDVVSGRSHRSAGSGNSHRRRSSQRPAAHAPADTIRTLTVVRARIGFRVERVTGDLPMAAQCATAFVDAVHAAARHTKAAVHSFVGDHVEASWNAVAHVPSAGAKAARFLAAVESAVVRMGQRQVTAACDAAGPTGISSPAVKCFVGGAAVSCRGKIQMAGSGAAQKALLLSVTSESAATLSVLSDAGYSFGAMLTNLGVAAEAVTVQTAPVATVRSDSVFDASDDAGFAPVHQIFGEATGDGGDGNGGGTDWLFALQQQAMQTQLHRPSQVAVVDGGSASAPEPVHTVVAHAFELAVGGRSVDAARRRAKRIPRDVLSQYPLVARFVATLRSHPSDHASADTQLSAKLCLPG
uniref:Uncharacterized protein n=1 Tax=Neobodo designis TaxID=312471 RepID=A0A7S1W971_NEODS